MTAETTGENKAFFRAGDAVPSWLAWWEKNDETKEEFQLPQVFEFGCDVVVVELPACFWLLKLNTDEVGNDTSNYIVVKHAKNVKCCVHKRVYMPLRSEGFGVIE